MKLKKKAAVYVFSKRGLLIFSHPEHPEVGFQVPSGTIHNDESIESAAIRELEEETGLRVTKSELEPLTPYIHDMRPFRPEIQERYPFLVHISDPIEDRWTHFERHPELLNATPTRFDFHWESTNRDISRLLAIGQGRPIRNMCSSYTPTEINRLEYKALNSIVQRVVAKRRYEIGNAIRILFPELSPSISTELLQNSTFGSLIEHVTYIALNLHEIGVDLAECEKLLIAAVDYSKSNPVEPLVLDSLDCFNIKNHGYETPLLLASAKAIQHASTKKRSAYNRAILLLRNLAFNETLDQCAALVIELQAKQDFDPINSYTLSGLPGTIYTDFVKSDLRLAETILHESIHNWLNHAFAELQKNGFSNKEYWSPWRQKPRPAYGIIHATFVFSRLCQFLDSCLRSEYLVEIDRAYARSRLRTEVNVLQRNLDLLSSALNEIENTALRVLISEELNRAINLSPVLNGDQYE